MVFQVKSRVPSWVLLRYDLGTMPDTNRKNWGLGDILGRSKEGFQPLNTDERDGMMGEDSDSEVYLCVSGADLRGGKGFLKLVEG